MSGSDKADPHKSHGSRRVPVKRAGAAPQPARPKPVNDVGQALRSAYDDALREDIPDDFRELLDKLG